MPKEKISMGLATYGRTYTLVNSSNTGIGAPSSGAGEPGKYTREAGFLSYYEVRRKRLFVFF
jgi:chitinase